MKRLIVCTTCLLLACMVSLSILAAADETGSPKDTRLQEKVAVLSIGQPVGDFLTSLSVKTGVKLTARKDVADHKLSVLVRDITVAELLASIQEVLHLRQTAKESKDGDPEYELWEDAKTKEEAEFRKTEAGTMLTRQMNHAGDVLKLPEEEIQRKIKEDPLLGPFIGDEKFRTAVHVYSLFDNRARTQLWETKTAKVSLPELPKDVRESVLQMFDENRRSREQMENIKLTGTLATVHFEVQEDPFASDVLAFHMMGTDNIGLTLLFQPSPEFGPDLLGNEDLFALKEDPETGIYRAGAKQIEGRLAEKGKAKLDEDVTLPQALIQIAEAEGINIVADHFTPRYSMASKVEKWGMAHGDTLADCIERVAGVFACRWTMRGNTCLLTSKHWFQDRDLEIPERTLRRWRKAYGEKNRFELKELMEIAALDDAQVKSLRFYGLFCPPAFFQNRNALKLAASLAPDQWESAKGEQGLPADKLTKSQKPIFVQWIESPVGPDKQPSGLSEADTESATIRIKQKDADTWVFRVETQDGRKRESVLELK